jgi:hypothetical protein
VNTEIIAGMADIFTMLRMPAWVKLNTVGRATTPLAAVANELMAAANNPCNQTRVFTERIIIYRAPTSKDTEAEGVIEEAVVLQTL